MGRARIHCGLRSAPSSPLPELRPPAGAGPQLFAAPRSVPRREARLAAWQSEVKVLQARRDAAAAFQARADAVVAVARAARSRVAVVVRCRDVNCVLVCGGGTL